MIRAHAYAKINLTLDVLTRREDGYHELDMLMQSVTLADELIFEDADSYSLTVNGCAPPDESNLVTRATFLLASQQGRLPHVHIHLTKNIPIEAGLGGGSSDAAATLLCLNKLWKLDIPLGELSALGASLGADIPFCLRGGTMRAQGIGEKLTAFPRMPDAFIVLCKPCEGVLTKEIFQALNLSAVPPHNHPDTESAVRAVESHNLSALCAACGNMLETVTLPMRPPAANALSILRKSGALTARMSGSGPTVFGIFKDEPSANAALAALPHNAFKTICRPSPRGVIIQC